MDLLQGENVIATLVKQQKPPCCNITAAKMWRWNLIKCQIISSCRQDALIPMSDQFGSPRQNFSSCLCPIEDLWEVLDEFEPSSADVEGTVEADAASLEGTRTRCLLFTLT